MADKDASKAFARKGVRVRIPLPAHPYDVRPCHSWLLHRDCQYLARQLGRVPAKYSRHRLTAVPPGRPGPGERSDLRRLYPRSAALAIWHPPRSQGDRKGARTRCPRCDGRPLDEQAYAYLLGLYLGDGHITHGRRGSYALNVKCCDDWPGLIDAAHTAMAAVMPTSSVCRVQRIGCTEVKSTSKHWPCLFPQHGPGRKHERTIELVPWQQAIARTHPGLFARGLFHSDGCRVTNRVRRKLADGDHWYEYPRYFFSNESKERYANPLPSSF